MIRVAADLHVHTCLSSCAERAMRPRAIVEAAVARGLGMIGVCDHNSAGNVRSVAAAAGDRLCVIAGMEIATSEEAHVVGLFPTVAAAEGAAREVAASLPRCRVPEEQELVDADGATLGLEPLLLSVASAFSLEGTVDLVHRHGGLAIAAHVDRRSFSVPSQLGFIPPDALFEALEVSAHGARVGRAAAFEGLGFTLTTGSDAHTPGLVGDGFVVLDVEAPCFRELALALAGADGRGCGIA
jgi:3',5'-nucleoside bisphosphate phosphatase